MEITAPSKQMKTNEQLVPMLCLVFGLVFGFMGGKLFADASLEAIKARLAEMGTLPPQPLEVKELFGIIKAINGDTIAVVISYPRDPFGDPSLDERMVTIDNNTKILVMVQKDQGAFEKELADYRSKVEKVVPGVLPDPSKLPSPPQIFDKKDAGASSLEVGATINITTAKNVKDQKSFTAVSIEVSPARVPSLPPTLPASVR